METISTNINSIKLHFNHSPSSIAMEKDSKIPYATPAASDFGAGSFDEKTSTKASRFSGWVKDVLLTVETGGIQRVTDEERQQNTTKVWNACTFWYVLNFIL
jgi:hypothetical protein